MSGVFFFFYDFVHSTCEWLFFDKCELGYLGKVFFYGGGGELKYLFGGPRIALRYYI